MFELLCDISDPDNPKTAETNSWPTCVKQVRCDTVPDPDSNATVGDQLTIEIIINILDSDLRTDERHGG